ncbi:MAG: SLBB domain-containing protein [Bdellovibrionia bacterium]
MKTKFAVWIILSSFISSASFAQLPGNMNALSGNGSEFFVGRIEGKPLITVNLLNGVNSPGVYHIPIQTNLAQLFAFAGGARESADLTEISIRSQNVAGTAVKEIDLEEIIAKNQSIPVLADKDTIMMESETDYFGKTMLYIGIIGGFLGIILSSIAIEKSK